MISLKSLSSTYRFKRRVLSSHRLFYSGQRRVMVSQWAYKFLFINWLIGQSRRLGPICDKSIFSLIGEFFISLIVECDLLANKTWRFCFVGVFPWLVSHGGLFSPENSLKELRAPCNKKRNLKPPWTWNRLRTSCALDNLSWMIVAPLLQRDKIQHYLTIRREMDRLCEGMEWKTMVFDYYQCQFEELCMVWIWNTTKHVISCSGSVWNGQRCNRWIVPPDLLSDERRWITMDDSRTQDHIRPRATIEKLANQSILQSELGSIVLLLFYYHVQLKNVFVVCFDSGSLLTLF